MMAKTILENYKEKHRTKRDVLLVLRQYKDTVTVIKQHDKRK